MIYYTDEDIEYRIPLYNEYIEGVVNSSELPKSIKKKMLKKRCIMKRDSIYYLEEKGFEIEFLTYISWLIQKDREEKLNELLGW